MKASSLSFKAACLFALIGVAMGIAMAASNNHAIMPAHAHLNLLGWVSLFLFGIYYRLHPAVEARTLALVQVGVWSAGTVLLTIAVAALHLGYGVFEPVAAVASLIVLAGLGLFTLLVFRADAVARASTPLFTAAE